MRNRIGNFFVYLSLAILTLFALTQKALSADFSNGNFETNATYGISTLPNPWAAANGTCDTGSASQTPPLASGSGAYFATVGLSGYFALCLSNSEDYAEAFKQEFTVSSSGVYQFSFDWQNLGYDSASLDYDQDGGWDYTIDVKNGAEVISGSTTSANYGDSVYSHSTANASLATGTTYVITFEPKNPTTATLNKYNYMGIDNISLSLAPNDSDANLTASSAVTEPVNLDITVDTIGEAIDLFDFTISDGGTSDALATIVSQIVLNVSGTANDTVRNKVTWRLNGADSSNVIGTYSSANDTITFSGLSISVADGASETYTVNGYFNDNTGLTAGQTIILSVDGDTDLTVDSGGTQFTTTSAVTNSTGITIVDTTPPTLSSSTPADNATAVGVGSNIVLNFSEAVDVESGNIAIKKTSDNSTVETIDVTSGQVTGTGTTAITINPGSDLSGETEYYVLIDTTAFDDTAGNSYAGISSTTALSFTTADVDSPTLSSSTPADGATGVAVDANIVLTFSEAVDTETGNIVLKKSSDDSTVETFDVASSGLISGSGTTEITINPTADLDELTGYYLTIATTAFDDSSSNSYAGISDGTTLNFTTGTLALPTPLNKSDVLGSVESWTNATSRWSKDNLKAINDRLGWLSRNKSTTNTSYQGIKLHFNNEIIDAVMNTAPKSKAAIAADINKHLDPANQAINLLSNAENALVAGGDTIKSDAQMIAINEAARLREDTIGSLNPSFKPIYGDWSMWTAGQVTVGEVGATSSTSKQESEDIAVTLGFDKPYYGDGLVGWSLAIGQSKTDIGTSTTEVESDNIALSGYSVIKQANGNTIESILGLGHLKFDTTRKNGSDTLAGKRDANQVFVSITIKNNQTTFEQDNWSITPYGKASASYTELDKFSESGASTALTYNKQTVNEAKVYVGADATYLVTLNNGTMTPFAKIEYGRDVSGGSNATMHYNSESTEYTLNLDKAAEEHWKLGIGTDIVTKDGWTGSFGYEREQAIGSGHSDSLKLDAKLKF